MIQALIAAIFGYDEAGTWLMRIGGQVRRFDHPGLATARKIVVVVIGGSTPLNRAGAG
jgi:hypothetical protein